MLIASMPMYDIPQTRGAMRDLWGAIASRLGLSRVSDAPPTLTFGTSVRRFWDDPDIFFSQCCGFDVVHRYSDSLCPIATPHFDAPFCVGPKYASVVVVRNDSPITDISQAKGFKAAINGPESHSGMSALRDLVSRCQFDGSFFDDVVVSGTHADSIALITAGKADIAAIDSMTFSLLSRYQPKKIQGVRAIGTTFPAMAPPYVLAASADEQTVRNVQSILTEVFDDPATEPARNALMLRGISTVSKRDYYAIQAVTEKARQRGYPNLV